MSSNTPNFWSIPRMWDGETAVIIGGGPSLTLAQIRHIARVKLDGKCRVVAVNDGVFVAWWSDWLHGCDDKWWQWHIQQVQHFKGIRTTLVRTLPPAWNVRILHNSGKEGFDPDPSHCRTGSNGVYQALHCLIHAGISRVILVGVDMKGGKNGSHWFGEHPSRIQVNFERVMIPYFKTLLPILKERGIKVMNCSPGSALPTFKHGDLERELRI